MTDTTETGDQAVVTAPTVALTSDALEDAQAPRKSFKSRLIPIIIGAVLISLTGLSTYLWAIHSQWVSQNDELRTEALAIGEDLARERATVAELEAELELVQTQLTNATNKITELADIEANAVDARNVLVELGEAFVACVDEQAKHFGYLKQAHLYTSSSLRAVENEITSYCNTVKTSFDEFKSDIG